MRSKNTARNKRVDTSMDQSALGWMIKQLRQEAWRLLPLEMDDLIQEGHLVWNKIATRYGPTVTSKAHLMALFKVSLRNHITNLAKARTRQADAVAAYEAFRSTAPALPDPEVAELIAKLSDNPKRRQHDQLSFWGENISSAVVVHAVLALYTDKGLRRLRRSYRRKRNGQRETTNDRLARMTGLPRGTDIRAAFNDQLGPD